VGRTQEIVYGLHKMCLAGRCPAIPIFVDSPLAVNATDVFRLHPECFDPETYALALSDRDPFGFSRLVYVRTMEESKALNQYQGPCVIISASGMCEAGRILHHLRYNIEDPRTMVLFVGFQAPNTLGRRLVEGVKQVRILGDQFTVRASIERLDGFSAHADRNEILDFMARSAPEPTTIFLVHGEPDQIHPLAEELRRRGHTVYTPASGESHQL
ncbi:MAG: MBL fold metallo-hydrolase, partial [Deinococcus sp.]|nr:MBL fold metallo-hydrolase [Deinococcus sp.]